MNLVESFRFGKIVINGQKYNKDLIVFPNEVKTNWWRKDGHSLCLEDLTTLDEIKTDFLVVGIGSAGVMKVPSEVIQSLNQKEIDVIVLKTPEAVEEYNRLANEGKQVAGAFHLTC
ncbi:MAG: Mth938-like domain-containing protein [Candidatus Heimdallarchaeota archaeon]|nr:Mth938-like domain-containing protein [Candidatus Heimdallarchaeota archaeon]MCK4876313.1 Mth938-like domain-containing protein [Candidatus Heimdallarchaeota archaeon]